MVIAIEKGRYFDEYRQGEVFYRKVCNLVFKMVKAPGITAVMYDDVSAAMAGEEVRYYEIPAKELMLDHRPDIIKRALTSLPNLEE